MEETTASASGTAGSVAAWSTGGLSVDRASFTTADGGTAIEVRGGLTSIGGSKLKGTTVVVSPGCSAP